MLSIMEFFLTDEITPNKIPINEAMIIAKIANSIVAGKREKISFATGFFV